MMRGRRERQTGERREVMGTKNADDKVRCAGFPQRGNQLLWGVVHSNTREGFIAKGVHTVAPKRRGTCKIRLGYICVLGGRAHTCSVVVVLGHCT